MGIISSELWAEACGLSVKTTALTTKAASSRCLRKIERIKCNCDSDDQSRLSSPAFATKTPGFVIFTSSFQLKTSNQVIQILSILMTANLGRRVFTQSSLERPGAPTLKKPFWQQNFSQASIILPKILSQIDGLSGRSLSKLLKRSDTRLT